MRCIFYNIFVGSRRCRLRMVRTTGCATINLKFEEPIYIYIYIYKSEYVCMCQYICMYVFVYVCVCARVHKRLNKNREEVIIHSVFNFSDHTYGFFVVG